MPFIETPRFPDYLAAVAVGGRGFLTTVVTTFGGNEFRNANWTAARGQWDISEALSTTNPNASLNFVALRNWHRVAQGQLNAFRFKDFTDFQDEGFGIFVQLTATTFQMYKNYSQAPAAYNQIIQKPVVGTVVVSGGVAPVVDYTTGIVTVSSGTPTIWTGQYDVPVRFAEDLPNMGLDTTGALYNWQSLKLIEVRP